MSNMGALGNIILTESLCNEYKHLDYIVRMLKKGRQIDDYWFTNGKLFMNMTKNSNQMKVFVNHISQLNLLFGKSVIDRLSGT